MTPPILDIDELVDGQRLRWFNVNLLVWSFLAMVADGYDLAGLASAAPALAMSWHLAPKAFAPALSASPVGILLGAPLLGHLGDRFGRKVAIITGCAVYGLGTLMTVGATDLGQVVALRFVTGIGLGGLMPNVIALNAEFAPRRVRAALIVLTFTGITTGGALPGAVQAWLIPSHGWRVVFWIGGLVPLAVACCLLFALPESIKHLALKPDGRARLLAMARRLRPDLAIADDAQFRTARAPEPHRAAIRQLLGGRFAWITPLVWVCFAAALMGNFFLNSWLPLILHGSGLTATENGLATFSYHFAGTAGGLLVSLVLARFGFTVIALLFLFATFATAAIGLPGLSYAGLVSAVMASGFCVIGAQFCNNAASGLLYATEIRSTGVGWALGVGRLGSIAGPLAGGLLIGKLATAQLFLLAAVPMTVGLLASSALAKLWYRERGTWRLEVAETPEAAEADAPTGAGHGRMAASPDRPDHS